MRSLNGGGSFIGTMLIVAAVFFLASLLIAGFLIFDGGNVVSTERVRLEITGPVTVSGGEEFGLQVVAFNGNSTDLKFVDLLVEYPAGSRAIGDGAVANRYRKHLGSIAPGESINENIRSVLFGEEASVQEVRVTLEYRTSNSNAIFVRDGVFQTTIGSAPVSIALKAPSDLNNDQEMSLKVDVSSNSESVLAGVVLKVDYPAGFVFKSANLSPVYGNNFWSLGDFKSGQKKSILITGVVRGQADEEKVFRVSAGLRESGDSHNVDVVYNMATHSLFLKKPFLAFDISLNGETFGDHLARSGDIIRGDIGWINNLDTSIRDGEFRLQIKGGALNKASVSAGKGFFRSADNTIIWNQSTEGLPESIEPASSGRQSFSFSVSPLLSSANREKNPVMEIIVGFNGTRTLGNGRSEVVSIEKTRLVKISSDLQLSSRAVYHVGPFVNSGPLPPIRDQKTTYTVLWSVINSSNDISGGVVRAILPSYVEWIGQVSPSTENVSYNPLSGEISWNIGDIKASAGVTGPSRDVAFQIAFVPSITQVGEVPPIVSNTRISGRDNFTGVLLSQTESALTIDLTSDPNLKPSESGMVR